MPASFDSTAAVALLANVMASGQRIAAIPEADRPQTVPEGYDVQDQLAAQLGNTAGWKLGLGSANAMKGAGVTRPLIGRMFSDRLQENNSAVLAPDGSTAMIEIEIAFTLARDVAPSDRITDPLELVARSNLVSEIVFSRFVDRTAVGLPSFAADNVGFHALVVGPIVDAGQITQIAQSLDVTLDGTSIAAGLTGDDAIDPLAMLGHLMDHARDRGITLKEGEVVTTGTLSKPFDANVPSTIEARTIAGNVGFTLKAK